MAFIHTSSVAQWTSKTRQRNKSINKLHGQKTNETQAINNDESESVKARFSLHQSNGKRKHQILELLKM